MGNCFGSEITEIFRASRAGSGQALAKLTPEVHRELQPAARPCTRNEPDGHTLENTACTHELYLRPPDLQGFAQQDWAHFCIICVRAHHRRSHKRGSDSFPVSLDETPDASADSRQDVAAVEDALNDLAKLDLRESHEAELRCFGELSFEETAKRLKASPETVSGDGRLAKAGCCAR